MKTSELTDRPLDWAVIKAVYPGAEGTAFWLNFAEANRHTVDWALAGPIIEQEHISLTDRVYSDTGIVSTSNLWRAMTNHATVEYGPTPLIAAMRCFVASKLGDEVEVPKELT